MILQYGIWQDENDAFRFTVWAGHWNEKLVLRSAQRFATADEFQAHICDYKFKPKVLTAVEVLKACDCYDYQSCETDDYHETTAAKLVDRIRKSAIGKLPGYEDAPWGITNA